MNLYDEEKIKNKNKKEKKISRVIITLIIVLTVLIIGLIGVIYYLISNPNKLTVKVNGEENVELEKIIELKEGIENSNSDEKRNYNIYAPIKDFAKIIGYKPYDGDYLSPSQNPNICNVLDDNNVSVFHLDSSIIYKKDLTVDDSEYEEYDIGEIVYEKEGKLYTNIDGLEKGFNLVINYDSKKKYLNIYTLDSVIEGAENVVINNYNLPGIDSTSFSNCRAILDNMIVVTSDNTDNTKYGVIDYYTGKPILETKFDSIKYIPNKKTFSVKMNGKVGIMDSNGNEVIKVNYDELLLIDKEEDLYLAKNNGLYGVLDKTGKTIIYLEYSQIGIDINKYGNNGMKTGYILLNSLIPVMQSNKWGFYDKTGKKVTELIYDEIGCSNFNTSAAENGLVVIPNYNIIVVRKDEVYTFVDLQGKEIIQSPITKAYLKLVSGEPVYYMLIGDKEYNIINELDRKDQT